MLARPHRARDAARAATAAAAGLVLALALLAAGCARRDAPADAAARAQALIESGNEAYRAGDFRAAARRYGAAATVRGDDPAAHYGLGMALARLGRDEEARAAYARARELARAGDSIPTGP
jgi:Tfp pilus assembly protein PilF